MATSTHKRALTTHEQLIAASVIIIATFLVSVLGGLVSTGAADPWYQALNKAPGTPPGFVFGIVWPLLYLLMATSAIMVWRAAGGWRESRRAMALFFGQLAPNLAWSYLFFGLHMPTVALVTIIILWILVAAMILALRSHSRLASQMQYPYIAWLTFATYLNMWIVFAN